MKDITIIGAGLSGTLLAMNLLRQDFDDVVHIKLIDRNSESDLGPAYSTNEDYLLNVPAEMMGAFSQDPEHFLKWAGRKDISASRGDYLQRKLYRKYILEMLTLALNERKENKTLERIRGEVVNIKTNNRSAEIFIKERVGFSTDKVVLALGNSPPRNLQTKNRLYIKDKRYVQNPWNPDIFKNLSPDATIIFIGTGQTMVDLVTALYKKKHTGKLITLSRHGVLPLSQKNVEPYPSFYNELQGLSSMLSVFQIVRKHLGIANEKGIDPRAVIDSLRPHTKAIWMQLRIEEKRRFLRHVFRYWEIIRSRIPPVSEEIIHKLLSSGQLEILTGRITDILPIEHRMEIQYLERGTETEKMVSADSVVNCIGPDQDYERIDQTLIKNLINSRLIHCDPAHLGIDATPEGSVIKEDGTPSDILYTIGLPLKGIVWESLAAPEIRAEAEELAKILLSGL
jgi:uncharacterized NAD(P)/FAD-binding protein YdhS